MVVKAKLEERQTTLTAAKKKAGKNCPPEIQEELDNVVVALVDVTEIYEAKATEAEAELKKKAEEAEKAIKPETQGKATDEKYEVAKGTEKHVHLRLVRGRRFHPMTGKEISKPKVQVFTHSEWQLFKANYKILGFVILEVLNDPYGDAALLVEKS